MFPWKPYVQFWEVGILIINATTSVEIAFLFPSMVFVHFNYFGKSLLFLFVFTAVMKI